MPASAPAAPPIVIIVHGADNPTRSNWVYRYYAYLLVENGYAVYLYDQRGHDNSTGSADANMSTLADDLNAIVAHFSKSGRVAGERIAAIGESRGGWVVPLAACRADLLKALVLVAGPSKGPVALESDVVKTSLSSEGYSSAQIDSALGYTSLYFQTVKDGRLWPRLAQQYGRIKARPWASALQPADSVNEAGMQWWRVNDFEPSVCLQKLRVPTLALFGEADVLVPAVQNATLMRQYLSGAGSKHKVVTIPNLPHGLYHWQTLHHNVFDWPGGYWIWPKRSVEMDEIVLGWLKENL